MNKQPLIIVESPTKARTIGRFLGGGATVLASQGHVRDLPEHTIGVDLSNDFKPDYELTGNGRKIVPKLKHAASNASAVYLATDPDREGEAIAWHLQEVLKHGGKVPFHRVTFHEITQTAINRAFQHPGVIALDMVDAQQARRVLDRLVGYQVSPLLWRNIQKGTSAGRVQTVALRLVVEREREIQAFIPVEYWNLDALFATEQPQSSFKARLMRVNGEKALVGSGEAAQRLHDALLSPGVVHQIVKVTSTPRLKKAPPPFITSTLQQAAGSALHLGAAQTMRVAQELYEGIDLGSGQVGLITYMRTDSVNIAKEAQTAAIQFIKDNFGPQYLPDKPNVYRSGKQAQEAHEAIRPTDINNTPESVAPHLTPMQLKVYRLIWNRFVASQMAPAKQMDHAIEVESSGGALVSLSTDGLLPPDKDKNNALAPAIGVSCGFHAGARETIFPGFLQVYAFREVGEVQDPDELLNTLPKLPEGLLCQLQKLEKQQCFTQPPSRYSEAALVKALESNGVGRPSTYAATVNTIQERNYVSRDKGALVPTELGFRVCDYLTQFMPQLFDVGFTAQMEGQLDEIGEGKLNWIAMLKHFYGQFQEWMGRQNPAATPESKEFLEAFVKLFPPDFKFDPPVKIGRRKHDDAEFVDSIRKRVEEKVPISDRQWDAVINMAARYAERVPALLDCVTQYGLKGILQEKMDKLAESQAAPREPVAPETAALLEAMSKITFKPPIKRGKRTFDDGKFYRSLREQVEQGKALTPPQVKALLQLASNYAALIPNYPDLVAAFGIDVPAPKSIPTVTDEQKSKLQALIDMVAEVKKWHPAESSGRRAFDDHAFVDSVSEQFQQKGVLSERQVAALLKVLGKYADQIHDFEQRTASLGFTAAPKKQPPQQLDETCPECGAKLVVRQGRRGPFVGCSAYPKCKYIKKA